MSEQADPTAALARLSALADRCVVLHARRLSAWSIRQVVMEIRACVATIEAIYADPDASHASHINGGGNLPPWVVEGCTCWDAECRIHGQEVVPHVRSDACGPRDNGQKFCGFCGKTLVEVRTSDDPAPPDGENK